MENNIDKTYEKYQKFNLKDNSKLKSPLSATFNVNNVQGKNSNLENDK